MSIHAFEAAIVREIRRIWRDALGTPLIPDDLQLLSLVIRGNRIEVQVSNEEDICFGVSVNVPTGNTLGEDPEAGAAEQWALWEVIVPLVEEIETGAAHRLPADAAGIRWVSRA